MPERNLFLKEVCHIRYRLYLCHCHVHTVVHTLCHFSQPSHQNPHQEAMLFTEHQVQIELHKDNSQHTDLSLPKLLQSRRISSNKTSRILAVDQLVQQCQELPWWRVWRVD